MERDFKGVWIPKEIWLNPDLSISEKCLLVEIDSLDNDADKGCFASNEHLSKFLGLSEGRTANMISDLRKRGHIENVFFDGRNRGLRVYKSESSLHENVKPELTKTLNRTSRKREHNNTVSNTDNNTERGSEKTLPKFTPPQREEVLTVYAQIFTDSKVKNARAWSDWEATKFFDHYTANGWKVGGKGRLTPMKNWQQAATRWAKKCIEDGISDKRLPDKYAATSAAPADFPKQRTLVF